MVRRTPTLSIRDFSSTPYCSHSRLCEARIRRPLPNDRRGRRAEGSRHEVLRGGRTRDRLRDEKGVGDGLQRLAQLSGPIERLHRLHVNEVRRQVPGRGLDRRLDRLCEFHRFSFICFFLLF